MNHLEEEREHLQIQTEQAFRSVDEIDKICIEESNLKGEQSIGKKSGKCRKKKM